MSVLGPRVRQGPRPALSRRFVAEHEGRRRYADLASVAAVAPGRGWRRVQYWTFAGVSDIGTVGQLRESSLSYDLTVIAARPMGWEAPKTRGHVHTAPGSPGMSYPELYEVLEGHAGFFVQDLRPGPRATVAKLIEASAGQVVLVSAGLHHSTLNLGSTRLVVADVICRDSADEYEELEAAHGLAYYIRADGGAEVNPRYRSVPDLERSVAGGQVPDVEGSLYEQLVERPASLEWLCRPVRSAPALTRDTVKRNQGTGFRSPDGLTD